LDGPPIWYFGKTSTGKGKKKKDWKKFRVKARKEAERRLKPMAEERVHGT